MLTPTGYPPQHRVRVKGLTARAGQRAEDCWFAASARWSAGGRAVSSRFLITFAPSVKTS